jgi:hypothetical protein
MTDLAHAAPQKVYCDMASQIGQVRIIRLVAMIMRFAT